ncbi:serine O-acetyltransferase [Alloalcanivorax xenomutans]|uniref:serine O-acetyltransferase n=1 Tax=Alloalcanivorax xenomutans TaxID=1094342 RepID=UPI0009B6D785|nr:hypothetical protein [Alloalcanivorax xenomutans]
MRGIKKVVKFLLFPGFRVEIYIRLLCHNREKGNMRAASFFSQRLRLYGLHISPKAKISKSVKFRHPTALVIGEGVVIEDDVIVYQSVTLGGANIGDGKKGRYPVVGSGTVIFSGVAIIGDVKIGRNCVIGANSVVKSDVPDSSVAVGSPARVVKRLK